MEGILRWPHSRLAVFARAHPEISICLVEGVWRAFEPDGDGGGCETHGRTEEELLAKLGG